MKIKYFEDTDTALIEFLQADVSETREISDTVYVDLDANGRLVSMTLEHARTGATLPEILYEAVPAGSA